ncbi:DUF4198 domain-containing protein [Paraglaciecola aquimarina]|uniref:DUF4198 domain-containing protein n=1 Tax=Paraglaciecola algarum TaxID=3050085 RepID=A0ABS9D506_9ALTE|nr:DUF4198 domain-containing protein [Paraglaciecola sp. G1-23]MCF2947999.1 DUF4198 domain-containing protein [Paraglaciecola sp. G1-23]
MQSFKLLFVLSTIFSSSVFGHGRWLLPSHTNLTGTPEHAVTFDMSISNDLFQGHYGYIQASKNLKIPATPASLDVIEPNQEWRRDIPFHWLNIRSSGFDTLKQDGTHHYVLNQSPVYISVFKDAAGELHRRFSKPQDLTLAEGAKLEKAMRYIPTIHTFVSRNKLTTPGRLNNGLELVAKGHPNDLFVGESQSFEVYFEGKPLTQELEIQVVRGNTRYRNEREQQTFVLKGTNQFEVIFEKAGMYLVEAELVQPSAEKGIEIDRWALFTTLEVNPE